MAAAWALESRPVPSHGVGCGQHAVATTEDSTPLRALAPPARTFVVVTGTLRRLHWQVLLGADLTSQATSLVIDGKEVGGVTGPTFGPDQWNFDRAPSGDWVYGAVPPGAARVRAVLRGGAVLTACAVHVPAPVDATWFVLATTPDVPFSTMEALSGGGRTVVERADFSQAPGSPLARRPSAGAVFATRP